MSNFANAGENLVADFFRGQGLTAALPAAFFIGLASAAADGTLTELAGAGYARQPYTRSLANWAGTQGSGTTLASNGVSHQTSNNNSISFGVGATWGTANFVTIHSAIGGGSVLSYHPITPIVVGVGVVSIPAGGIVCTVGLASGASDYTVNNFIDTWFRGQSDAWWPSNGFFALFTTAPTDAGGGVEVNLGNYARQSTPLSLLGFSNTAAAGTTTAAVGSGGTGGVISNNLAIAFPIPSVAYGTILHEGVYDLLVGGNLLFHNAVTPVSVLAGSSPQTHAAGSWTITIA